MRRPIAAEAHIDRPLARTVGSTIFISRWLQAPLYLGLIAAQGVYVWRFMQEGLRHYSRTSEAPRRTPPYLHRSKRSKGTRKATTLMIGVGGTPRKRKKETEALTQGGDISPGDPHPTAARRRRANFSSAVSCPSGLCWLSNDRWFLSSRRKAQPVFRVRTLGDAW
jgi:hypothetical protein